MVAKSVKFCYPYRVTAVVAQLGRSKRSCFNGHFSKRRRRGCERKEMPRVLPVGRQNEHRFMAAMV